MNDFFEAVMVCPHVLAKLCSVHFFCRTQDGLVAACDENCDALETGNGLEFIHLSHFYENQILPMAAFGFPINACLRLRFEEWKIEYFDDETIPQPGEFRLADISHPARSWLDREELQTYVLAGKGPVTITLDEGIRAVPVWSKDKEIPKKFTKELNGTETLILEKIENLRAQANLAEVSFFAVDFLVDQYDVGILTGAPVK